MMALFGYEIGQSQHKEEVVVQIKKEDLDIKNTTSEINSKDLMIFMMFLFTLLIIIVLVLMICYKKKPRITTLRA